MTDSPVAGSVGSGTRDIGESSRGRPPSRNEVLRGDRLGGADPADLARRFGTPLYVYDLAVVTRQVQALASVLPVSRFDIAYSLKANQSLALVAHIASLGLGGSVSSLSELSAALRAGIPPERLCLVGPAKSGEELRAALRARVGLISVESCDEAHLLASVAQADGLAVRVLLRHLTERLPPFTSATLYGDFLIDKFGMADDELVAAAMELRSVPRVQIVGLHTYAGSNIRDADLFSSHVADSVRMAVGMSSRLALSMDVVNVGGGIGIPIEIHDPAFDLALLGRRMRAAMAEWSRDRTLDRLRIRIEPGRFVVGPAGAYLASVVEARSRHGEVVAIIDGGVHQFLRPLLMGQEHRVRLIWRADGRRRTLTPTAVAGPLTTALDVLARAVPLPHPAPGDLLAILDVGAYGFVQSMPYFSGRGMPAEVVVWGGDARMVRPRMAPGEMLDEQILPDWSIVDARTAKGRS